MTDIYFFDTGSLIGFHAATEAGRRWWTENVEGGPCLGSVQYDELRYASDIIFGAGNSGLTVESEQ